MHPDFASLRPDPNEVPDWWSRLLPQFRKACKGREANLGSEYICGSGDIRPLYYSPLDFNTRLLSEEGADEAEETDINKIVSKIGLEYVLKRLVEQAADGYAKDGPLQKRAMLALLYNAVGRPGEVKFVDSAVWKYHSRFQVLDIVWAEMTKRGGIDATCKYYRR